MRDSIRLFTVGGIAIRMHITFPLILVWGAVQFGMISQRGLAGALFGVAITLLLFVIVVLHELGHSFAARHFEVPVRQIVLLPIGGVAQLARIPENPGQEFVIAIAGPLVNFILAALLIFFGLVINPNVLSGSLTSGLVLAGRADLGSLYRYLFTSNLFLGLFNLLPAFPMDGGRVLRALLASRMPYLRATVIAVAIGQALAWLLGLWGFLGGGFFLIVVALFIYFGARQEGEMVQLRSVLANLTVEQAYSRQVESLSPTSTLREAAELTLNTFQADFPVCDDERLVGIVTHSQLVAALHQFPPDQPVGEIMTRDVAAVSPREGLFGVQRRLAEGKLDALPVAEGSRFLGLITARDISEAYSLASNLPELRKAPRDRSPFDIKPV